MAKVAVVSVSGTNSGAAAADVNVQVNNPLDEEPDAIYCLWKDGNCLGVNATYDSATKKINVTLIQVSAGATANAEIFVQKEHSIWKGYDTVQATVNSASASVSGVENEPDLVLVTGGYMPAATWTYDSTNKRVDFTGLSTNDTNVRILKLHSIQHNQNGTTDGTGNLTGQNEKPDILIKKGNIIAVQKSTIDTNYDSANKRITGLSANSDYISIPIHSIFK